MEMKMINKNNNFNEANAILVSKISNIDDSMLNKIVKFKGQISNIVKIKNFQIITLFDGYSSFTLKDSKNYNLNKGDVIDVLAEISKHKHFLEGTLKQFVKLENKEEFVKQINQILINKTKPIRTDFMIESDIYNKLKSKFIDAASEIRKAVMEQRPIVLRHHGDVDGYCAGLSIEKSILSLMKKYNSNANKRPYYTRSFLRTPYYDYVDCVKDISILKENMRRYDLKDPLFIITDTGSSTENLLALNRLKLDGYKVIVIDHHFNGMQTDKLIDIHINPHLVEENSSYISAGFLSNELANFICEEDLTREFSFTALISGYGDNCYCNEMNKYMSLFKDFDETLIKKAVGVIYFESFYVRIDGPTLINELLYPDYNRIKQIVDTMYDSVNEKVDLFVEACRPHIDVIKHNSLILNIIPISEINYSRVYPSNMRIVGVLHNELVDENPSNFVMSIGHTNQSISFRGSHNINSDSLKFSVVKLVSKIKADFPHDAIDGGGHALAGTIRFSPILKDKLLEYVIDYIKAIF